MRKRELLKILVALTLTMGILLALGLTVHAAEYNLWIKDVQVTDENKADILGDGIFSYDSDKQILTLKGDCISGSPDKPGLGITGTYGSRVLYSEIDGLTIDVEKDSLLNTSNTVDTTSTVDLKGDTTIKGNGKLSVYGSHHWNEGSCDAIRFSENTTLTIHNMDFYTYGDQGIKGGGKLEIISSNADLISNAVFDPVDVGEEVLTGCIRLPETPDKKNEVIIRKTTHKVVSGALNVREKAGTDSNRIGGLVSDAEVVVLETEGEWSKIPYGTGYGWVQTKYLKEIEKATYTVTFDANGGSGTMPTLTVQEGEKLTLPECTFTPPEGKVFDRWIAGNPGEQVDVGGDSIIRAFWKDSSPVNPFEDIYESDDYYNAVLWAYYADPQVTNGMDETHFGPQLTVTRGQCVTFLWRSQGCPEPSTTVNPFVDVPSSEYFYKPILWAVENGITKGVDDTHFNPMDTLSTQHIITFLYRTKNSGMDGWNGEAAAWAADSNGKPFGVDIAVNNTTPCPRCHVVQFLYKLSK